MAETVRCFRTFTQDLYALAAWLQRCGIKTVAMESTGVYWIPLFQILEDRGFEVYLVNARHVKNVPGRRTDVSDCQWLQFLHSVGLLRPSYRPEQEVCAIRSLLRHRESLVQMAATHVQHVQKALDQMNLQLHNVISDITGVTGLAIIDAILAGKRDPRELAELRSERIKATEEAIAKSLVGDYRAEPLHAGPVANGVSQLPETDPELRSRDPAATGELHHAEPSSGRARRGYLDQQAECAHEPPGRT
jgi:transposase